MSNVKTILNDNETYNFAKIFRICDIFTLPNSIDSDIIELTSIIGITAGDTMYEVIYDSDTCSGEEYTQFVSVINSLSNGNIFCLYEKYNTKLVMMYRTFDEVCHYILKTESSIEAKVCDGNLVINDQYEIKKTIPLGTEILMAWYQGFNSRNETFGAFKSDGPLVTKLFTEGVKR